MAVRQGNGNASAVLSDDGRHRHWLERFVNPLGLGTVLFAGVNPSTAEALIEDPTSRKWWGFTDRIGFARYIAVNPFDYRSKVPSVLGVCGVPWSNDNLSYIVEGVRRADLIVPCWGNVAKVPKHLRFKFEETMDLFRASGKPIKCFGQTADGSPRHPLFVPYGHGLVDLKE